MSPEELKLFKEEEKPKYKIKETGEIISLDRLEKIISIYQQRLKKLSEISELIDFFFRDKLKYNKDLLRWQEMGDKEVKISLDRLKKILSKIRPEDWTEENLEKKLLPEAEKFSKEIKEIYSGAKQVGYRAGDRGYLLWPLRVALTGKEASAGPFEIAEILRKEKTIKRIKEAKEKLK